MEYIEKIKKKLCKELEEYAEKQRISGADLKPLRELTDIIKNLDKIAMLEEDKGYSEARGRSRMSYDDGMSYDDDVMYSGRRGDGRGRGRYAKRDSMGRYSSNDGMSYEDERGRSYRGSSYDDGKDYMMSQLGEMMEDADPKQREVLKDCMRALERA
jgi:hypothetical protein